MREELLRELMIDEFLISLIGSKRPAKGSETISETKLFNNYIFKKIKLQAEEEGKSWSSYLRPRHIRIQRGDKPDEYLVIDETVDQVIDVPDGKLSPEQLIWQAEDKCGPVTPLSKIPVKEEILVTRVVVAGGYCLIYTPKYGRLQVNSLLYEKWVLAPGFCLFTITCCNYKYGLGYDIRNYQQTMKPVTSSSELGYLTNYKILKERRMSLYSRHNFT